MIMLKKVYTVYVYTPNTILHDTFSRGFEITLTLIAVHNF